MAILKIKNLMRTRIKIGLASVFTDKFFYLFLNIMPWLLNST